MPENGRPQRRALVSWLYNDARTADVRLLQGSVGFLLQRGATRA